MKKEVFLAISIGFALGLVITFGIWTANKSLASIKNAPTPTPTTGSATAPTPESQTTPAQNAATLNITSPADEAFVAKSTLTVTGKATPGATIVLLFENDDDIVLADAQGNFSSDITLIPGYNNISVSSFDAQGAKLTQAFVVTYSTAKI